ncbi:IS3 family transposase [uncultured Microscilla sp.]|uniref:IS3 family transposase n=1 Tax=uncultured Microscilla sp. TaxID=432653 RepID=UPI00260B3503|nr:IS3 family transposase [uncultured Microscilla sp.]
MNIPIKYLYLLCAISKQAHAQALAREKLIQDKRWLYIGLMLQVRELHPGMGLRKMYNQFQPEGIGRDAFIAIGMEEGLRLQVSRNPTRTTWGNKRYSYPNLLAGIKFTDVNQVWSSDITYYSLEGKHYYIVFIMDVYSRKIVGYSVADHMRASLNIAALEKALNLRGISDYERQLIHHSDRGSQYISEDYTHLLTEFGIRISMCREVLENAHIERVNGTIKNEYLRYWDIRNFNDLEKNLKKAVENYNNRAHNALKGETPNDFEIHLKGVPLNQRKEMAIFTRISDSGNNANQLNLFKSV